MAGLAEIGGGYLVWLWLRERHPFWVGALGGLVLFAYGIIATRQAFSSFGKVYAAYGGVFIVLSLLFGWWVSGRAPTRLDWIGAAFALLGVTIMLSGR